MMIFRSMAMNPGKSVRTPSLRGFMRSRTRSIRFRIFALIFVPLFALTGIWAFAASVTIGEVVDQRHRRTLEDNVGAPAQGLIRELGQERLASVTFLSGSSSGRQDMNRQRARTDPVAAWFRKQALASSSQRAYPAATEQYAAQAVQQLYLLPGIRSGIDTGAMNRVKALEAYNGILDSLFRLFGGFSTKNDIVVYRATQGIVFGDRGLDMIGRESALVAAAAGTEGRLSKDEHTLFIRQVHIRRFMMEESRAQMAGNGIRSSYDRVFASPAYRNLTALEDEIINARNGRLPVRPESWQPAAQVLARSFEGAALSGRQYLGARTEASGRASLIRLGLVGGVGLLMVVLSVLLSVRFGRRVSRELTGLQGAAQELADVRLPRVVERLRRSEDVDVSAEVTPLWTGRITEVADVATSFATVQRTAIEAAVGQAELRKSVGQIFLNLARRNQSLLYRQLAMLDTLESRAEPDVLEDLFRLDHLTTRMRRHAEGLIILSGAVPGRGWRDPVPIIDVLRGAVAEVEDYTRVAVLTTSQEAVIGSAVADVIHLLAELMENATSFSPPNTEVHVMAEMVGNGLAIEIEDRGLGTAPSMLEQINRRLADPPELDLADADRLGLFVVGRLAGRHGIEVALRRSPYGGTTAIALLPHAIVVGEHEPGRLADGPDVPVAVSGVSPEAPVLRNAAQLRQGRTAAAVGEGATGHDHASSRPTPAEWPQAAGTPQDHPGGPGGPAQVIGGPGDGGAPAGALSDGPPGRAGASVPAAGGADAEAGTHAGLPRRVRQKSLVPQLRAEPTAQEPDDAPENIRSPEQAGAVIASVQAGWRRGRAEATTKKPLDGERS
jgi:signal transduction histidine kinase